LGKILLTYYAFRFVKFIATMATKQNFYVKLKV